jgi:hypothetical protein
MTDTEQADETTPDDPMTTAETRKDDFEQTLADYDDPLVSQVHAAVAAASVLAMPTVGLSTDKWLDVLETTAGDLYLSASSDRRDSHVVWYLRHDGAAFIYGTKRYGEMYRGDPAAVRQVRSVIENHDVTPYPMTAYPSDRDGSFIKDSTEGGENE